MSRFSFSRIMKRYPVSSYWEIEPLIFDPLKRAWSFLISTKTINWYLTNGTSIGGQSIPGQRRFFSSKDILIARERDDVFSLSLSLLLKVLLFDYRRSAFRFSIYNSLLSPSIDRYLPRGDVFDSVTSARRDKAFCYTATIVCNFFHSFMADNILPRGDTSSFSWAVETSISS